MSIQCRRADDKITDRQLQTIAGLIYDTDQYIYPAMFKNRQEAETVLPRMMKSGDPIFSTENLYVAADGKDVVGALFWKRGPVLWNTDVYEKCGGGAENISRVAKEYFQLFAETSLKTASVVRIGVRENRRGQGIGHLLMDTFMRDEPGPYELYVLIDNTEAIRFFTEKGFMIWETRPGFSLDYSAYPCYWMVSSGVNPRTDRGKTAH